jgi:hypothetical protein
LQHDTDNQQTEGVAMQVDLARQNSHMSDTVLVDQMPRVAVTIGAGVGLVAAFGLLVLQHIFGA